MNFAAAGGDAGVTVSGRTDCSWSVSDNRSWLTVTSPVSGGQSVTITATANTGSSARTGTVTIGNLSVSVSQDAHTLPLCSEPGVTPAMVQFGSGADSAIVQVVAASSDPPCRAVTVNVSEDHTWITAGPSSVAAGQQVTINVTANDGESRMGTVTIGTRSVTVIQTGAVQPCPTGPDGFGRIGDHLEVDTLGYALVGTTVTGRSDCTWPVSSTVDWIKLYSANSGTLSGGSSLRFSVARNTGVVREGAVTLGTRTLRVSQEGAVNSPPTATAGPDQTVEVGVTVALDGTATDPDGDLLTFSWAQKSGSTVVLELGNDLTERSFLAPATTANASLEFTLTVTDTHGAVSTDTVTVTVRGQVLTGHRDRLLADWAQRQGYGSDVCAAWDSLDETEQQVFIWNTHRLHRSNMLPEVKELHAIYGKQNPDTLDTDCGGSEYNRTFMVTTPALRDKFIAVYEGDPDVFPAWEITGDLACSFPGADCPHWPFHRQIETHGGHPRGQINFFLPPEYVLVERSYYIGTQYCSTATLTITLDAVCTKERCNCGVDGLCPLNDGICNRPNLFSDEIYDYYTVEEYQRGPDGDELTITNDLMFEMDQDYNRMWHPPHDSAPSCGGMTTTYASNYGDPGWNWQPTRTAACVSTTGSVAALVATSLESEATPLDTWSSPSTIAAALDIGTQIRAAYVMELRARVDALRVSVNLSPVVWTDPILIAGYTPIKAAHLTELRTALNAVYGARGREAPSYTDDELVAGLTLIATIHLTEVRVAIEALGDGSGGLVP